MAQAVFTSLAIQKIKVKRQDDATKKQHAVSIWKNAAIHECLIQSSGIL